MTTGRPESKYIRQSSLMLASCCVLLLFCNPNLLARKRLAIPSSQFDFVKSKQVTMKLALAAATLVAGVSAFSLNVKAPAFSSTALFNGPVLGAGGMADTRDPAALKHEDPRKSISEAPSFEEYLKMRSGGGAPAPAPAAAAPAPAPAASWTPTPAPAPRASSHGPVIGAGGMADTRDPAAMKHEDPRKSISEAPSFEEYLKMRSGGGAPAPAAAAPAAPAAAAPVAAAPSNSNSGKYDGKLWDMDAKMDVYNAWNPNAPRSAGNFNPFETWDGNSPDSSGFYPGEGRYKDPIRPDVNFAKMQAERAILDNIAANPKPGNVKGCPGCRT
jgi:hypothetical protein